MADITIDGQAKEQPTEEKKGGKTINLKAAADTAMMIERKDFPPVIVKPVDEKISRLYIKTGDGELKQIGEVPADILTAEEEINNLVKAIKTEKEADSLLQATKKLQDSVTEQLKDLPIEKIKQATKPITEQIEAISETAKAATKGVIEQIREQTAEMQKTAEVINNIIENMSKNSFSAVTELFGTVSKVIEKHPIFALYIEELEKISQEEEYKGIDLTSRGIEYLDEEHTIEADTPKNRALHEAYRRAVERYEKEQDAQKKAVVKVEKKSSPSTMIPIDKINRNVWKGIEETETNGQINFQFLTGKQGKRYKNGIEPLVTYSLDFSSLEERLPIVKKLTSFDKRVMVAVGALYNAGNTTQTLTDIYHKMGYGENKRPNSKDLEKINDSLTKQLKAHLRIDNMEEERAGLNYPKYKYDSTLLQFERVTAEIDGKTTEGAVHFFREPPLLDFARGRGQITTVKNAVLESPLPKTDKNLKIDDYLIEEISFMKRSTKFSNKIMFNTLFEACGLVGDKNPARIKATIKEYLDHYKRTAFIEGYEVKKDYILIKI